MGLKYRLTCPHLDPESEIPGSDDGGPDRPQGGRNPSWIGLPQALHGKMSVFCARQKREGKRYSGSGRTPLSREREKVRWAEPPSAAPLCARAKGVSAAVGGGKGIENQNHLGTEIRMIKTLIITYCCHGPLKLNFGKINNQKFAFMGKVISPGIFLKILKFGYRRCKSPVSTQMIKLFSGIIATVMVI